jgi:hypothetical protein
MSTESYPQDLTVTKDDFLSSGWRDALPATNKYRYSDYWSALSKAARAAMDNGAASAGKVLWLLADACSMALRPESRNETFQPFMIMQGKRSAIPEDYTEADLIFFEEILPEIDDYRLKARLADILWLVQKPRKVEYALFAIDSYVQFPLGVESFLRDGKNAWHRAIRLTLTLRGGAGERMLQIRDVLFAKFREANFSDGAYALWLAELLEKAYLDEDKSNEVASKLVTFAKTAADAQDWNCAREYYEGTIRWNNRSGNKSEVNRLYADIAETWVSEAEQRAAGNKPSNMAGGHFFECAIQTFRKIPKKDRATHRADERIAELHKSMNRANKLAIDEMKIFKTSEVDISQSIEASREQVVGRAFPEVLLAFANLYPGAKVDEIAKLAKKNLPLFRCLSGLTHMTRDGRVAARSSAAGSGGDDSPETKQAIRQEMINHYCSQMGFVVQAQILPALQIVSAEHRITERTLLSMCRNSHVLPPRREALWVKGLFFGFEGNFIVSTHLLIPQVEHLVRIIMKQSGLKTTTLDSKGIETENGLSTLLEHPDIKTAIDKNLLFEFRALLTEPNGPNLRNETAHGLLEAEHGMSAYAVYLWWLCLRLVVNSIDWKIPNHGDGTSSSQCQTEESAPENEDGPK